MPWQRLDDALTRVPRLFVLLGAIILGIALAPLVPLPPVLLWTAALLALVAAVLLAPRAPAVVALTLLALPLTLHGIASAKLAAQPAPGDVCRFAGGPSIWIEGVVASEAGSQTDARGSTWSATLAARSVDDYERVVPVAGRLLVTARDNPPPAPGDVIRVRGRIRLPDGQTNPDGFNERAYLARRGIHATLVARRSADVAPAEAGSGLCSPSRALAALRVRIASQIDASLPPDDARLLDALLLSRRSGIPPALDDAFARAGASHVLSASGLHLAAVAGALAWLLGALPIPRRAAGVVAVLLLWLFAETAGGGPGVTRAAIMATVVLLAPLVRRAPDPLLSWAFAAFVLLVADPLALYDPGFEMSFGVVFLILLYLPPLERWLLPWEPGMRGVARATRGLLLALLVSVVASLAAWPLIAYNWHLVSLVGPASNAFVTPLSVALLFGGMTAVGISLILPALSFPLWGIVHVGLFLLRRVVFDFAAVPGAALVLLSPPAVFIVAYYAALIAAAPFLRRRLLRRRFTTHAPPVAAAAAASAAVN